MNYTAANNEKLDSEASRLGLMKNNLSREDTIQIYYKTKHVLGIPDTTPKGRKRNWSKMAWSSVARLTTEKKRNSLWKHEHGPLYHPFPDHPIIVGTGVLCGLCHLSRPFGLWPLRHPDFCQPDLCQHGGH